MPDSEVIAYRLQQLESRVNSMEKNLRELLDLANRGRGAFWAGMVFASLVGAIVGFFGHWLGNH